MSPLCEFFKKREKKVRCPWLVPAPLSTLLLFFFFVTIEDYAGDGAFAFSRSDAICAPFIYLLLLLLLLLLRYRWYEISKLDACHTPASVFLFSPFFSPGQAEVRMADCGRSDDLSCYDKAGALHLKVAAIAVILISSSLGVTMPLLGQHFRFLKTEGNAFFIAKAFAAGIILATGFVHMLPDAASALTNSCLPDSPWSKFPFFGFFAMVAALGTLVVDFGATEFYERLQSCRSEVKALGDVPADAATGIFPAEIVVVESEKVDDSEKQENRGGRVHIVGMRAHAAAHSHSHPEGHHECADITHEHVHGHVGHTHGVGSISDEGLARIRHVVIAQVLELGIVAHSVIIGIALGVSNSPCTIRPLLAALSFHQFFEGFALGGCISQARYKMMSAAIMAFFFAVTTPGGIAVGIGISSSYDDNSPRALIVEGIFDSVSAGILVYMALVDLIAADFLSKRMRCNYQLQLFSYTALFLGAGAMSGIALWA